MSGASSSVHRDVEQRATEIGTDGRTGLPTTAMHVVHEVVRGSRLRGRAAREVQQELVAHFLDGLDAGHSVDDLIAEFGDTRTAARLVRSAKMRQQPFQIRVARRCARMMFLFLITATLAYLSSAASLYLSQPPTSSPAAEVARNVANAWRITPPAVQTLAGESRERLRVLQADADGTRHASRLQQIMGVLKRVERLRQSRTVAGDRLAAEIEADVFEVTAQDVQSARIGPITPGWHELEARLQQPVHLDGVRHAFDRVLNGMYSDDGNGNGRLTAQGIEVVRILKKWHVPTFTDRLAEPAWYSLPASRQSVLSRFERLVGLVETPAQTRASDGQSIGASDGESSGAPSELEAEIAPLCTSMLECLRYPSLTAVLPELVGVLAATHRAQTQKAHLLDLLTAHTASALPTLRSAAVPGA